MNEKHHEIPWNHTILTGPGMTGTVGTGSTELNLDIPRIARDIFRCIGLVCGDKLLVKRGDKVVELINPLDLELVEQVMND